MRHRRLRIAELSDDELVRRYDELRYHAVECALAPDHPTTRTNRDRWARELVQVEAACNRRGLLETSS